MTPTITTAQTRRRRRLDSVNAASRGSSRASSRSVLRSGCHERRPLALVTGATSGIGLAVAHDLAHDHDLILLARTASDLEDLARLLHRETGCLVTTCAVDLTLDTDLAQAIAELGVESLDVLVHSAGVEGPGVVEGLSPARWRDVLDLDLVAVAHLTSLLLPAVRDAQGLVVFINSGAGQHSWPGQALYSAAKHGLVALADALREEERGQVRVTSIYPGRVDTPMQKRLHRHAAPLTSSGRRRPYRARDHMRPGSVASCVRLAVSMPHDTIVEDLSVRPEKAGR